jgi:hypothetical protein
VPDTTTTQPVTVALVITQLAAILGRHPLPAPYSIDVRAYDREVNITLLRPEDLDEWRGGGGGPPGGGGGRRPPPGGPPPRGRAPGSCTGTGASLLARQSENWPSSPLSSPLGRRVSRQEPARPSRST